MNRFTIIVIIMAISTAMGVAKRSSGDPITPAPATQGAPDDLSSDEGKTFYSKPNAWSNDKVLAARKAGSWRGDVRLDRQRDGHFYTTAQINGASFHALIDTGASVVALTGRDARAAGLDWNASEVRPVARGASGTVRGVVRIVPRLDVDGIVARNVEVMIIPEGLDVTLIGQNFLSQIRKVEIRGGQMILSND